MIRLAASAQAGDDVTQFRRELTQARALGRRYGATPVLSVSELSSVDRGARLLADAYGVLLEPSKEGDPAISDQWHKSGLTITVVVASFNYRDFIREAVDSVLAQTYAPDQLIISDDCSTDGTADLLREIYGSNAAVTLRLGETNLGIEEHFNTAVALATSDLVVFLGADNRFPPHYVERAVEALVVNTEAAIAYTDFAFFGPRAHAAHVELPDDFRGAQLAADVFCSRFPQFSDEARDGLLQGKNFIHGSSTYRRAVFNDVGGYASRSSGPEDWGLFKRILLAGHGAVKVEQCLLEYRQHSDEQANMQFAYFWELAKLRHDIAELREALWDEQKRHAETQARLRSVPRRVVRRLRRFGFFRSIEQRFRPGRAPRAGGDSG